MLEELPHPKLKRFWSKYLKLGVRCLFCRWHGVIIFYSPLPGMKARLTGAKKKTLLCRTDLLATTCVLKVPLAIGSVITGVAMTVQTKKPVCVSVASWWEPVCFIRRQEEAGCWCEHWSGHPLIYCPSDAYLLQSKDPPICLQHRPSVLIRCRPSCRSAPPLWSLQVQYWSPALTELHSNHWIMLHKEFEPTYWLSRCPASHRRVLWLVTLPSFRPCISLLDKAPRQARSHQFSIGYMVY